MPARYSEKSLYGAALISYELKGKPLNFEEFATDVNRLVVLTKLVKQNKSLGKDHNLRLLLNWIVISFNVFGLSAQSLIFSVADESIYSELISLFLYLNRMPVPPIIRSINGDTIDLRGIAPNLDILKKLDKEVSS